MNFGNKWVVGVLLSGLSLTVFSGCDPVPEYKLTESKRLQDLSWIESQFEEFYGPQDYKEARYGFQFKELMDKARLHATDKYRLEAGLPEMTNDDFYDLMFSFVSEFKDAHTSASLTNSSYPSRAHISYLGFSGIRDGDALMVKKFLPSIKTGEGATYPVQADDRILAVNGKSVKDIILTELVKFRDLGQEEANLTYHMNKIFTRVSTMNGSPKGKSAVLTVERLIDGQKTLVTLELPWVVQDLSVFKTEQAKITEKKAAEQAAAKGQEVKKSENFIMAGANAETPSMVFNFVGFNGRALLPQLTIDKLTLTSLNKLKSFVTDSFMMVDHFASWEAVTAPKVGAVEKEKTPIEVMRELREITAESVFVDEAKAYPYPAFVSYEKDGLGNDVKVGTIYVDTFSPSDSKLALEGFKKAIELFQNPKSVFHTDVVVIDMINNGGGSLLLGLEMASALSNKKIEMPKIQFKTSESWIEQFRDMKDDLEVDPNIRVIAGEVWADMDTKRRQGARMSAPFSVEVLSPYRFNPNPLVKKPFKIALLVNEMCASMCDIFTAALKDNDMAIVVGSKTMGAGGNVVNHNQAPNSHVDVRQTESLLLRKDGTYLENNGVEADVKVAVNETAKTKYIEVRAAALKALLPQTPVVPERNDARPQPHRLADN